MALSARWTAAAAALLAVTAPASALNLPFGLGRDGEAAQARPAPAREEAPVRLAQAGDAGQRIMQLEEENRRLNGKVEELSFQMLQIQEQLRKMQEDNDFRFQELEGAASGGAGGKRTEAAPPAKAPAAPAVTGSGDAESSAATPGATSTPPAAGGDEIGNLLGGGLDVGSAEPAPAPVKPAPGAASSTVAAVTPAKAGELYDLAYNYLLAGDYQLAENSFRQYSQTYPDAKDVPDAQYWLGESLYAQTKYADAAETFLNAQKKYPKSPKAPEMMLKLGMSLSKLDNRETACVTFKEVSRRYPQMSANVKRKLDAETKATSC